MKVKIDSPDFKGHELGMNVIKAETTVLAPDGQQYKCFMLDGDDTFDFVVEYPNNEREIVWSLVKEA